MSLMYSLNLNIKSSALIEILVRLGLPCLQALKDNIGTSTEAKKITIYSLEVKQICNC